MMWDRLDAHERDFRGRGIDSDVKHFDLAPGTVTVPGTGETMHVVGLKREDGVRSYFYDEATPKRRIALHFTAGYLKGDVAALTKRDNHVSVPFIVARDGTIYQLFPSSRWSYHLGKGAAGGNEAMSRSSVAIELSNIGPLRLKDGVLLDAYGWQYCSESQTGAYVTLPKPFRGYRHFATYTDAQYKALSLLVRYLAATYSIPLRLLPDGIRYDVLHGIASWEGITTHVNYQPESYGKWDLPPAPAFDWARLGVS